MSELLSSSARILAICWRQHRGKTLLAIVLVLAGTVAVPLTALALREFTDAALAGRVGAAVWAGVAVAALAVAGLTFAHLAHVAYFELSEVNMLEFDRRLMTLSNGSPGLAHHEHPEYADRIAVLEQEIQQLRAGLQALLTGAGIGLALILTAVLLALLHPILLLLPVLAVPPLLAGRWAERLLDRARGATAGRTRMALNLFRLSSAAGPAKELRVFGLQHEVRRRHRELRDAVTRRLWRAQLTAGMVRATGQLVFAAGYVGAVLLVVRAAVAGDRTVGDVVLVITVASQVNQQVAAAVAVLADLQRMAGSFRRLAEIEAMVTPPNGDPVGVVRSPNGGVPDRRVPDRGAAGGRPPERLSRGIDLVDVAFRYPGADSPVLSGVNLFLPAGSTVAIVGENGAGKSTLVKLLCGFYPPTAGRILIDGEDLTGLPLRQWRDRIAAGFQDFVRYEFLARETVGVGDLPRLSDEAAVLAALERGQATGVLDGLPEGLDQQLGRAYADGVELSGGQWQKLALGRAFMRERPLLVVLDEPTAALDAEAEHALFAQYAEQAQRTARLSGAVTVFVSHRFSTVRMADLIVVVDGGRIAELGEHSTLVRAGGLYAELYAMQARAYAGPPVVSVPPDCQRQS
jgi:ATP-binding cassette subfamily B protein